MVQKGLGRGPRGRVAAQRGVQQSLERRAQVAGGPGRLAVQVVGGCREGDQGEHVRVVLSRDVRVTEGATHCSIVNSGLEISPTSSVSISVSVNCVMISLPLPLHVHNFCVIDIVSIPVEPSYLFL